MNPPIQKLDWSEVRQCVEPVNPTLAGIIDAIPAHKRPTLIKASYGFGDLIVQEGRLQLPISNEKAYAHLNYSPIPLSLLLNQSSEVFIEDNGKSAPLNILKAGDLFGTFETANFWVGHKGLPPAWSVSSGARTTFLLPRVSAWEGMQKLRAQYHFPQNLPLARLSDHWSVFKAIARNPVFTTPWKSEALFFPKAWFTQSRDLDWLPFYQFVLSAVWHQAQYAIKDFTLARTWKVCGDRIAARHLKPSPYILDTLKHLLLIMMGTAPAWMPATEYELPLTEFQRAFTEVYPLERYAPTMMAPALLNPANPSGYYALSFPNPLLGGHSKKSLVSFMPDLRMLKWIIEDLLRDRTPFPFLHNINVQYFHALKDKLQDVDLSAYIPTTDSAFSRDHARFPDRVFCANSPFWQGCIRMTYQTEKSASTTFD